LFGEKNAETIVYDNAIEAGNKVLANVNVVKMFGKPRAKKMFRLHASANKGDTSILTEPSLDLVAGDRIGIAATNYIFDHGEDFYINSYNNETGEIGINGTIVFNHWGAAESTADKYNGVDIRAEVVLLTRNIKIVGEDVESWGCQIVTSDTVEFVESTGELKYRNGQMLIDNVEIYNCS